MSTFAMMPVVPEDVGYSRRVRQETPQISMPRAYMFPREGRGSITAGSLLNVQTKYAQTSGRGCRFVFHATAFTNEDTLESDFKQFVAKWREEVRGESSLSKITANIYYLKVIKLGVRAVPLILKEVKADPAPWFLALRVLTDNAEIGRAHPGNFEKKSEAWIKWGKERGLA